MIAILYLSDCLQSMYFFILRISKIFNIPALNILAKLFTKHIYQIHITILDFIFCEE